MTTESPKTDINTDVAPSWFEVENPEERELWATFGQWNVDPPQRGPYRLTTTEAEAILWARTNKVGYLWNGRPAFRANVETQLAEARKIGRPGVCVMTYVDNKWIILERYSV